MVFSLRGGGRQRRRRRGRRRGLGLNDGDYFFGFGQRFVVGSGRDGGQLGFAGAAGGGGSAAAVGGGGGAELRQRFDLTALENAQNGLANETVLSRRLNHGRSLVSHDSGQFQRINGLVGLDQVQGRFHQNQDAGSADSGRAMHHGGAKRIALPSDANFFHKIDEFVVVVRHAVVRPRQVCHLRDVPDFLRLRVFDDKVSKCETLGAAVVLDAGHFQPPVFQRFVQVRPVLVALDPAALDDRREHDDQGRLTFPSHVPEIGTCRSQRPLSRDVSFKRDKNRLFTKNRPLKKPFDLPVDNAGPRNVHDDVVGIDVITGRALAE